MTATTVAAILGGGAGSLVLGACGGGNDHPPETSRTAARPAPLTSPVGHVFRALSVQRNGRPLRLFDEGRVLLEVDRDGLATTAGCNAISATLRVTPERFHMTRGFQTAVGCPPPEGPQEDLLASFFFGPDPSWRLDDDRLVLARGRTTITWVRDDRPPSLPTSEPAPAEDLVAATFGTPEFKTWPWGLSGWGDPFVKVDVAEDDGRATLTMRESCRQLRAPVTIGRTTLDVGPARLEQVPCSPPRRSYELDDLRRFFGGEVMWHLDRRGLTLQRERATLTLPVR